MVMNTTFTLTSPPTLRHLPETEDKRLKKRCKNFTLGSRLAPRSVQKLGD